MELHANIPDGHSRRKYLAGIQAPTDPGTSVGCETIHIQPYVPDDLTYAEASVETVRGYMVSRWEKQEDGLKLDVTLPVGARGRVSIPLNGYNAVGVRITESGSKIWQEGQFAEGVDGIHSGTIENGYVTFEVTSGKD